MEESPPVSPRRDLVLLLLLVVLTTGLRLWQIARTELASRDSIGYIRTAWRMRQEPIDRVIVTSAQHPAYAVAIYGLSGCTVPMFPDRLPMAMQLAAQLVSATASVMLVVCMFLLGRQLFDGRIAFWAALWFQILPSSGRLMPDGLSEPLFLAFVAAALVFVVGALKNGSLPAYLAAGGFLGLAYLTRAEGLILVPLTAVVALGMQFSRSRLPWKRLMVGQSAFVFAFAGFALPFMLLVGGLTNKASLRYMTDPDGWKIPAATAAEATTPTEFTAPLSPAIWWIGSDVDPSKRRGWAVFATVSVLDRAFMHLGWPLTLIGLWLFRKRFMEVPALWVMLGCGVLLLPLLWRLAHSNGYLSERHVQLHLFGAVFFAVAAVFAVGKRLGSSRFAVAALVLLVGIGLPKSLEPLHGNRAGLREAGEWLAQNTLPGDFIIDPLAWTHFHAGRPFVEGQKDLPRTSPEVCYVVYEEAKSKHQHLAWLYESARGLAARGTEVYRSRVLQAGSPAEIVIVRVNGPAPDLFRRHQRS